MRLYLVRHGEAMPENEDPERRLTAGGVGEINRVAAFLAPLGLRVGTVWHSGKARAAQTAAILASALEVAQGCTPREGLNPNDPIAPVRAALVTVEEDLMIVGHLPFMGRLAAALLTGDETAGAVIFPTGGALCLERNDEGEYRVLWMVTPELLGFTGHQG